jgi:hypothetical protein
MYHQARAAPVAIVATVRAAAIPAMAPLEMPAKSSSASSSASPVLSLSVLSGEDVDVAKMTGTSSVDVVEAVVVVDVGADVLLIVELLGNALLPTAGGPSVLPSRAIAACLIFNAVSPESPAMLKRSE